MFLEVIGQRSVVPVFFCQGGQGITGQQKKGPVKAVYVFR
jgi:hypothetical protein